VAGEVQEKDVLYLDKKKRRARQDFWPCLLEGLDLVFVVWERPRGQQNEEVSRNGNGCPVYRGNQEEAEELGVVDFRDGPGQTTRTVSAEQEEEQT
jgi:hypothetical protein